MKKVKEVSDVTWLDATENHAYIGQTTSNDQGIIKSDGHCIKIYSGSSELLTKNIYFKTFIAMNNVVALIDSEQHLYFCNVDKLEKVSHQKYFLHPIQSRYRTRSTTLYKYLDPNTEINYLILPDKSFVEIPVYPKILLPNAYINFKKSFVEYYSLETHEKLWDLQIPEEDQVERRYNGQVAITDGNNIYVRLSEGRLIRYDLQSHQKIWKFTPYFKEVSYSVDENYVYSHYGYGIHFIDKESGIVTKTIDYKDYPELKDFSSNDNIFHFDQYIITRDTITGYLALFDRHTLELLDCHQVDDHGIGTGLDRIRYCNNHLYILGASNTVHIYSLA